MTFPMLADFALRLACGLSALLLLTPGRLVPPAFFRTHCLVILGLLVVAALDSARAGVDGPETVVIVAAAVLAYLAAVAWGLGVPRVGVPVTAMIMIGISLNLVEDSRVTNHALWVLNGSGRLASAFLLGSAFSTMLLGHHYLTAPAMSIEPLKRFVRLSGWGLAVRALLGAVGVWVWLSLPTSSSGPALISPSLLLAMRWGVGVVGPAVALLLAWKTVEIRSTQSATGILYIAVTLVLFGELTALVLSRETGVLL
jgi:hypothetical protein